MILLILLFKIWLISVILLKTFFFIYLPGKYPVSYTCLIKIQGKFDFLPNVCLWFPNRRKDYLVERWIRNNNV